jgi:hypothetical protein
VLPLAALHLQVEAPLLFAVLLPELALLLGAVLQGLERLRIFGISPTIPFA